MLKVVFFIVILKTSLADGPRSHQTWIIRNVGQGQWVTLVKNDICIHFDFGGEFNYFKNHRYSLIKKCKNKMNVLMLSHTDWDHYAYFKNILKIESKKTCWGYQPPFQKSYYDFDTIPYCKQLIYYPIYTHINAKTKNKSSAVHIVHSFLITGDSTTTEERRWVPWVNPHQVKFLVVGHHGSKTSTSETLLQSLTHLKMAFISSRKARYGHPHPATIRRLQKFKIPYLTTEDWGTIIVPLL